VGSRASLSEEIKSLPLPVIEPGRPTRSLVTKLTELYEAKFK